jgi:ABC-type sugar transport system ATPase subunit
MGLHKPKQGQLISDNTIIDESNMKSWRSKIGYIPQSIYLFDGTVAENVIFGLEYDKAKLIKGEKGNYLNITAFVNLDEKDQYDNNGMITQSVTKEERDNGTRGVILGNTRVFYTGESSNTSSGVKVSKGETDDSEDIPF